MALVALVGCGDGALRPEDGRFELSVSSLAFGAVLQGQTAHLPLEVRNLGRARTTITLSTAAPFQVSEAVELGGGEVRRLEVGFQAGAAPVVGRLTATDGRATAEVTLSGEGVVPLDCVPSSPCHVSTFDLGSRTCIETVRADGSSCIPESLCLDAGTCVAGACVGQPRACDDQNACTDDACSEVVGCVHTPRVCPSPTRACHVATCEPDVGCGEAPAQNLTPCGEISCASASLCMVGVCQTFAPAPDGMPCGMETPCRAEATCRAGSCDIPEATPLVPAWSLPLTGEPSGPLRGLSPDVFVQTCDPAGGCALESFTGIDTGGFSRWFTPLTGATALRGVDAAGLCTQEGSAVVTFDPATGTQRVTLVPDADAVLPVGAYAFSGAGAPERLAIAGDGTRQLLAFAEPRSDHVPDPDAGVDGPTPADAGVEVLHRFAPDGGLRTFATFESDGSGAALALGADGTAWVHEASGRVVRIGRDDGGLAAIDAFPAEPGPPQAAIAGSRLVVGGRTLMDAEGQRLATLPPPPPDGGASLEETTPPWVMLDAQAAYLLATPCEREGQGACRDRPSLTAYAAADGAQLWSVPLDGDGAARSALEAALLETDKLPLTGVGVLFAETEGTSPAGWVRFYALGAELEACRLPGAAVVLGGLFQDAALYTAVERNGTYWLEAYPLAPFTARRKGWPQPEGVSGTRREH